MVPPAHPHQCPHFFGHNLDTRCGKSLYERNGRRERSKTRQCARPKPSTSILNLRIPSPSFLQPIRAHQNAPDFCPCHAQPGQSTFPAGIAPPLLRMPVTGRCRERGEPKVIKSDRCPDRCACAWSAARGSMDAPEWAPFDNCTASKTVRAQISGILVRWQKFRVQRCRGRPESNPGT